MTFQQGDKVICTNPIGVSVDGRGLVDGNEYTVERIKNLLDRRVLILKEFPVWLSADRFKKAESKPVANSCTCDIIALMSYGCKCGQIQREKNDRS